MIKAIETEYAGCRFRSRLEARWAVLFDALGLDWAYELEGFELPSGRYLPDFRVWFYPREIANGFWAEIKGAAPSAAELTLAEDLHWATRRPVVVFFGDIQCFRSPGAERFERPVHRIEAMGERGDSAYYLNGWRPFDALPCRIFGEQFLAWSGRSEMHYGPDWKALPANASHYLWLKGDLSGAVRAARSARFEHGARGWRQPAIAAA